MKKKICSRKKQTKSSNTVLKKIKMWIDCIASKILVRILIVFFVAFLIIIVIFMFSPQNASLYYESNNTRTINNIDANFANVELNTDSIKLEFDENIRIRFTKGIINGEHVGNEYDGQDAFSNCIDIRPLSMLKGSKAKASVTIKEINNNAFDFRAYNEHGSNVKCSINAYEIEGNKSDNNFKIYSDNIIILNEDNYALSFNMCDAVYDGEPVEDDVIILSFEKEDGWIEDGNGLMIHTGFVENNKNENFSLSAPLDSLSGRSEFFNVSNASIQGIGELNFALPSTLSKYDLNLIELFLKSDDNNLVVTCDFSKDNEEYFNANISGIVNDAKISNYDLFPTFKGWVANNIFLLPTAIIASILIPILYDISKGLLKKDD